MFDKRSSLLEILDLGPSHYTPEEYHDCLIKLDKIGAWLGGHQASLQALAKMKTLPASILDVGCGGGHFTILMAQKYPQAKIVGIDIDSQAIAFANKHLSKMPNRPTNVTFALAKHPELNELPKSYDVVISTLVCHHLNDDALVDFLQKACLVARHKVIINDLHRHLLTYMTFKMVAPIFFRNRLILHDGALSIKRAFKKNDWKHYLLRANIHSYSIQWRWAFRWIIDIDCSEK